MRNSATIAVKIAAILGILAGIYSQCSSQVPLSETNAVTLKPQVLRRTQSEVDPISQRLTIAYAPITERKTRSLKTFARKVRRVFRPNQKT